MESMPRSDSRSMPGSSISSGNPVRRLTVFMRVSMTSRDSIAAAGIGAAWGVIPDACLSVVPGAVGAASPAGFWLPRASAISLRVLSSPSLSGVRTPSVSGSFFSSSETISTRFMESMPRSDSRSMPGSSISSGNPVRRLTVFMRVSMTSRDSADSAEISGVMVAAIPGSSFSGACCSIESVWGASGTLSLTCGVTGTLDSPAG